MSNTFIAIKERVGISRTKTLTRADQVVQKDRATLATTVAKLTDDNIAQMGVKMGKKATTALKGIIGMLGAIKTGSEDMDLAVQVGEENVSLVQDICVVAEQGEKLKAFQALQLERLRAEHAEEIADIKEDFAEEQQGWRAADVAFGKAAKEVRETLLAVRKQDAAGVEYTAERTELITQDRHDAAVSRITARVARTDVDTSAKITNREAILKEEADLIKDMQTAIDKQEKELPDMLKDTKAKASTSAKKAVEEQQALLEVHSANSDKQIALRLTLVQDNLKKAEALGDSLTKQLDSCIKEATELAKGAVQPKKIPGGTE
jgi:hypothetical protein